MHRSRADAGRPYGRRLSWQFPARPDQGAACSVVIALRRRLSGSICCQRAELCERIRQQPAADFGDATFANIRVEDFGKIAPLETLTQLSRGSPRAERGER